MSSAELKLMAVLNTGANTIPKELLQTKTIVVISISGSQNNERGDWKDLAEQAHFYVKRLNIDAVLYFYIDDMIAGPDIRRAITEQMVARDIKNVLLLSKDKIGGRDQYIGVLTSFDLQPTFISNNQAAWKSQTSDMEILFRNLARSIDRADLTLENLLIIDSPEYFRNVDIIRGKRFELFNTDLRIDRLAVPVFEDLPLPQNAEAAENTKMVQRIHSENEKNLTRNSQIEQMMATYPYEFKVVPYEFDEKKLALQGFQFVLMRINSSGRNVREMLGYDDSKNIRSLITIKTDASGAARQKSIPIDGMVYKYYIKHINSGDIYLGEQWDGDESWQEAFDNHIKNVVKRLEKR